MDQKHDILVSAAKAGISSLLLKLQQDGSVVRSAKLPFDDDRIVAQVRKWCDELPGLDVAETCEQAVEAAHRLLSMLMEKEGTGLYQKLQAAFSGSDFFVDAGVAYVYVRKQTESGGNISHSLTDQTNGQVLELRSSAFKEEAAYRLSQQLFDAPKQTKLAEAITCLSGKIKREGERHPVYTRLAAGTEQLVLDLGNDRGQRVIISADGWSVADHSPHYFRRPDGMLPLPVPEAGGDISLLRPLVNLASDADFRLLVAWLIGCFHPAGPYPVLMLIGQQGSAKSSLTRLIRRLIDPCEAAVRSMPTTDQNLVIAALNNRVMAYDNLSGLNAQQADALCRLATGGSFGTRRLYTDSDEAVITAARPVILNGISDITDRADLLERAIMLKLPTMPESLRQSEEAINAQFEDVKGRLLGALLDAVAAAMRGRRAVKLSRTPRMADFAAFAAAGCAALPWSQADFEAAYHCTIDEQQIEPVLDDPFLSEVVKLVAESPEWRGTATELKQLIERRLRPDAAAQRQLPQKPQAVRAALDRHKSALRLLGVEVNYLDRRATRRELSLRKTASRPPGLSSSSSAGVVTVQTPPQMPVFNGFGRPGIGHVTTVTTRTDLHPHFYLRTIGAC